MSRTWYLINNYEIVKLHKRKFKIIIIFYRRNYQSLHFFKFRINRYMNPRCQDLKCLFYKNGFFHKNHTCNNAYNPNFNFTLYVALRVCSLQEHTASHHWWQLMCFT